MKIMIDVPAERIAGMMTSLVESGDPVTRGWCCGLHLRSGPPVACWYARPEVYERRFQIEVRELAEDDGDSTNYISHMIGMDEVYRGLTVMAVKYPHLFRQVLQDDTDAPCADIFLQCTLFGEEKYA